MSRLVDADKFRSELDNHYPFTKDEQSKHGMADIAKSTVLFILNAMPTVDAVEVVRCHECKRQKVDCPMRYSGIDYPSDNSFCGWGKKKSG